MSTSSSQLIMASCSSQPMGDLESVKRDYDSDDHALRARITANLDTALHVAVGTGRANRIVEYLLNKMSKDQVALQNRFAIVGNIQAAELLVKEDENLNRVANNCGWIPLIEAAQHQKKEMTKYLLQFTEGLFESEENGSTDTIRVLFMNFLIGAKFYGLALELVKLHPSLATMVSSDGESLLKAIARKPSAFPSKIRKLDIWGRCFTGKLAPQDKLNLIPGAAMQMQREIQWFKEVEKIVPPRYKHDQNLEGKTPKMVFSEEHKGLVKEGEHWMKSAATSSSVAAALIATVVFSAAITVPGDYNNNGKPNLHEKITFLSFGTTDTISMFSSLAAIIMFLSILTSRYTEADFLYALPMKLIQCLALSLFSATATMVAFATAVYLVFFGNNLRAIALVVASLCLPIYLFASSQYTLLAHLLLSTFQPGVLRKQTKSALLDLIYL